MEGKEEFYKRKASEVGQLGRSGGEVGVPRYAPAKMMVLLGEGASWRCQYFCDMLSDKLGKFLQEVYKSFLRQFLLSNPSHVVCPSSWKANLRRTTLNSPAPFKNITRETLPMPEMLESRK